MKSYVRITLTVAASILFIYFKRLFFNYFLFILSKIICTFTVHFFGLIHILSQIFMSSEALQLRHYPITNIDYYSFSP